MKRKEISPAYVFILETKANIKRDCQNWPRFFFPSLPGHLFILDREMRLKVLLERHHRDLERLFLLELLVIVQI